jgi:integrase
MRKGVFPQLRRKGNALYFDTLQNPRKWIALGSDELKAMEQYRRLIQKANTAAGTVSRVVAEYLEYLAAGGKGPKGKPITASSLVVYRKFAKKIDEVFGEMDPRHITQGDISKYLYKCPRTSGPQEVSVLSGAYQHQMRLDRLSFDPCIGVKTIQAKARRGRLLEDWELKAIYGKADPKLKIAIDLGYALGLRPVDIVHLRWDQFTTDQKKIVEHQKTKFRQRWLVDDEIERILAEARAIQGRVVSMFIICRTDGKPYDRDTVSLWFREAAAAAGIEDAQLRDIRAKAITDKEEAEGMKAAQDFAGHTDDKTTEIYVRSKRVVKVTPNRRKTG